MDARNMVRRHGDAAKPRFVPLDLADMGKQSPQALSRPAPGDRGVGSQQLTHAAENKPVLHIFSHREHDVTGVPHPLPSRQDAIGPLAQWLGGNLKVVNDSEFAI